MATPAPIPILRRWAFLAATIVSAVIALAGGIRVAVAPDIAVTPVVATSVFALLALAGVGRLVVRRRNRDGGRRRRRSRRKKTPS